MVIPTGPVTATAVASAVVPAADDAARALVAATTIGGAAAPTAAPAAAVVAPSAAAQLAFPNASALVFSPFMTPLASTATLNAALVSAAPPTIFLVTRTAPALPTSLALLGFAAFLTIRSA